MSWKYGSQKSHDDRSKFANAVCALIYQKHSGDTEKCMPEIKKIRENFDEHVRNVYELSDREIPLFGLYELIEHGADNYGLTDSECKRAKQRCIEASVKYYSI